MFVYVFMGVPQMKIAMTCIVWEFICVAQIHWSVVYSTRDLLDTEQENEAIQWKIYNFMCMVF